MASRTRLGPAILIGMLLYCLPTTAFLVVDQSAVAVVLQALRGAGTMVVDILAMTALQRSLPKDVLGRVFGAFFSLVIGAIALGALVTPAVISAFGLDTSLVVAGVGLPALSLLGIPLLRRMDKANAEQAAAIQPRVAALGATTLFAAASRGTLERLASQVTELDVPEGQTVVAERNEAAAAYVIVAGEAAVSARGEHPEERPLPGLGVGDHFGEIGLLRNIPRTATVRATTPLRLLRIDAEAFAESLTDAGPNPELLQVTRLRLGRTHPTMARQASADPA